MNRVGDSDAYGSIAMRSSKHEDIAARLGDAIGCGPKRDRLRTIVFSVAKNVFERATTCELCDNGPLELLNTGAHHEHNVRVVNMRNCHFTRELEAISNVNERKEICQRNS